MATPKRHPYGLLIATVDGNRYYYDEILETVSCVEHGFRTAADTWHARNWREALQRVLADCSGVWSRGARIPDYVDISGPNILALT